MATVNKKKTKKIIEKDSDKLFDEISNIDEKEIEKSNSENISNNKKGRKVKVSILHFDIEDTDNELVEIVKNLINESNITNQDVYDNFTRHAGWNMIYGLRKNSISWSRVKQWCNFLGYSIELSVKKIDNKTTTIKKKNKNKKNNN